MIIPSIDIMNSKAVQLVGGKELKIEAGSPLEIAKTFSLVNEMALIDLDAALGKGNNENEIKECLKIGAGRVGGGIRTEKDAIKWLDAGASKIIIGSRANKEFLSKFPKKRLIAAVDSENGEIVTKGWTFKTGKKLIDTILELREHVSEFLVTFVECEGKMKGFDFNRVKEVINAAKDAKVTIAGGVTTKEEIRELDSLGADAQVGMALYTKKLSLSDSIEAIMNSDREDKLWPTVVTDERGIALGLCYSNPMSLSKAIELRQGVYWSRKRGLWIKGASSNNTQTLLKIDVDCDRDCLRFKVRQKGEGFCHLNKYSCWGKEEGLKRLERVLEKRIRINEPSSYTQRLINDKALLNSKILEEARELVEASKKEDIIWEASDLIYFTLVKMMSNNIKLSDVESELNYRNKRITRRGGDKKP